MKPQEKTDGWLLLSLRKLCCSPTVPGHGTECTSSGWLTDLGGPMAGFGVRASLGVAGGCERHTATREAINEADLAQKIGTGFK